MNNDYVKQYEETMINKAKQEMNLKYSYEYNIEAIYSTNKLTIDGKNYFNEIEGIKVLFHNVEIASYNLKTKKLSTLRKHRNIVVMQRVTAIANDFLKNDKYSIDRKKLTDFYTYLENVYEADSNCDLSEYEIAEMYSFMKASD